MKLILLLVSASMTTFAANSYHATFPATENPISEGSKWTGGQSAGGNLWGDMRTTPALAFGVSEPTQFGDPTAILTGSWGATQTVQGTAVVSNNHNGQTCCFEIELRLRHTISSNSISGYEAYCSVQPSQNYCHIARWNGANGSYCNIESSSTNTSIANGDVMKATISGTSTTTITLYKNGTQVAIATDTGQSCSPGGAGGPFTSGTPGMGTYNNQGYTWSDVGFSDFWATDGVPVLDTTTATSVTASGASSGGTVVNNGGASVSSEGTCYATSANPTTPCTSDGTSTPFTSTITGLSASTLYHYRSFATNSNGTGYGPDLTFTTSAAANAAVYAGGIIE